MSDQKVFVDGMLVKLPGDDAPDFVKLKLSIKLDEFGLGLPLARRQTQIQSG